MKKPKSVFAIPKSKTITARSSSITHAFASSIIPVVEPSENDIAKALSLLKMNSDSICCAYCGDPHSEWDHLRPIVRDRRPTGYITEIKNLVPSCGKCNQSKGNKNWDDWIVSSASLSPMTRKIGDLEGRIECLRDYSKQSGITQIDFEKVVGSEKWKRHWVNWQEINELMISSQEFARELRGQIEDY